MTGLIFENQSNRLGQILLTLFNRAALTVSAPYLRAEADKPFPVLLNNHSKFRYAYSPSSDEEQLTL